MIPTLEWLPEGVNFLDQTKLPLEETYVLATDYKQVATVIRDMIVRGAPAIGVAAAMGMALGIERSTATTLAELTAEVATIAKTLNEKANKTMRADFFLDVLDEHYPADEAKRQFSTAVEWARYAELFEYDADEEVLSIEQAAA